ncbi:hypothetical protein DRJ17_04710 [Candidatus Woesearchaeota archaeon]|nr:MAG: hypothetical protein DRJ17_04710 [Candidatus Woesearchaeota archaeon]
MEKLKNLGEVDKYVRSIFASVNIEVLFEERGYVMAAHVVARGETIDILLFNWVEDRYLFCGAE